ncbi:MAG: fused MFS/spermidine synthase [Verrucomicrobiota bacterium]
MQYTNWNAHLKGMRDFTNRPFIVISGFLAFNAILLLILFRYANEGSTQSAAFGPVIFEETSDFSHIRVRETSGVRSLFFVDSEGREQRQSSIDINAPHQLQLGYTSTFFSTLLFRPKQERVLIVGLGGGGMVRFANHSLPQLQVDVVEIDPVVVEVADQFFGTRNGPKTTIFTQDAFVYLKEPHGPYDVIYMDAFLRPRADSELEEIPQRLKTAEFIREITERLKPDGLVAFNLIEWEQTTPDDLAAIDSVFPAVYRFSVPGRGNLVVIGSMTGDMLSRDDLAKRAADLADSGIDLPFAEFADSLRD